MVTWQLIVITAWCSGVWSVSTFPRTILSSSNLKFSTFCSSPSELIAGNRVIREKSFPYSSSSPYFMYGQRFLTAHFMDDWDHLTWNTFRHCPFQNWIAWSTAHISEMQVQDVLLPSLTRRLQFLFQELHCTYLLLLYVSECFNSLMPSIIVTLISWFFSCASFYSILCCSALFFSRTMLLVDFLDINQIVTTHPSMADEIEKIGSWERQIACDWCYFGGI